MLKYLRNRRGLGWIVGSFLLVLVIFAFIALYVPDFMSPNGGAPGLGGDVAWVEGEPISTQEFLRGFRAQDQQYRQQMGEQYSPDLLRQLGLDTFVVQQLVQEKVLELEAERLGLSVSDDEVRRAIVTDPGLQRDGQFIGAEAYRQLFVGSDMTPATYEQNVIRPSLVRQKLQQLVTDGILVTEEEVEEEFRRRNERANLEYVVVSKDDFGADYEPTDEEVRAFYDANPERFERPVQRRARFITLTPQLFAASVNVTDREIQRYYERNRSRYTTEDQITASHILFKTDPGTDEDAVRAKAESVLAEIRAGGDFAELAREHSEDSTADRGGDLGPFGRNQMVPEFEEAAFALEPGETSDLVRTTYGFHIIRVTDKQEQMTQPLDTLREQIRGTLTQEKSQARMEEAITSAAEKLRAAGAIDALSAEYPLLVPQDTEFFSRDQPLPQLGNSAEASRLVFETEINGITPAIPLGLGGGYAFLQVLEERDAAIAPFDEVAPQAREILKNQHALDLARERAAELRAELAAGDADVEFLSSDSFFRGSQLPEAGASAAVQAKAFELAPGELSDPLPADNGYVILRVVETSGFDAESFGEQKSTFEQQLVAEQRSRAWSAFVSNLQSKYDVRIDWQTVRSLVG